MTDRPIELDDLLDSDLPEGERARIERAHDLLVRAGAPPELPPSLAEPPPPLSTSVVPFPRRRRWTAITAVAAAALLVLAVGYGIGNRSDVRPAAQTVALSGDGSAEGSIEVFAKDDAGNWPLRLVVSGLPEDGGKRFELWLTRGGVLTDACGSFAVQGGAADVRLTAPYRLQDYDDWVVVAAGSSLPLLGTKGSAATYRAPPA